jgi:hypothetical protein
MERAPLFAVNINWKRLWVVVFTASTMWTFLSAFVPAPYFTIIGGVLNALAVGISTAIRADKWVSERNEIPPGGTI